jgi:hypothetical protein
MAEPEEEKEEKKPKLNESEDDNEEIQCSATGAERNAEEGTLVFKIFDERDEKNPKIYYCVYDKRELTEKQRKGLRGIANMIEGFLWERGDDDDEFMRIYA